MREGEGRYVLVLNSVTPLMERYRFVHLRLYGETRRGWVFVCRVTDTVGLMDENYFLEIEDSEWSMRMKRGTTRPDFPHNGMFG